MEFTHMNGTWKMASSEKFDDYMKALGVNIALRKLGNLAKPTLTIEVDLENFYYKSVSTVKTIELRAKIGPELDETTADGRKVKTIFSWKGNTLVQTEKWDGKVTTIERYVDENGELVNICTMGDIVCKRVYKK